MTRDKKSKWLIDRPQTDIKVIAITDITDTQADIAITDTTDRHRRHHRQTLLSQTLQTNIAVTDIADITDTQTDSAITDTTGRHRYQTSLSQTPELSNRH